MAEEEKKIVSEREEEQTQLQSQQQPTIPDMSPNDRKFMDKLVELMEQNMDNGDLVVCLLYTSCCQPGCCILVRYLQSTAKCLQE